MEGPSSSSVTKGAWTEEEDTLLRQCIEKYGEGKWHKVPSRAGLNRCRKSCRLRWLNYLNPNIKRGAFAADEVDLIIRLHNLLGNRWSLIAGRLPGRTANDVKNYWNTHLMKKKVDPCSNPNPGLNPTKPNPSLIRPRPQILSKNSTFPVILEKNKTAAAAEPSSNISVMMTEAEFEHQQHLQGSINNMSQSVFGDQTINEELDHSTTSIFQLSDLEVPEEDNYGNLDELFHDVDLWNVFNQ